jgi:hypothetical protein
MLSRFAVVNYRVQHSREQTVVAEAKAAAAKATIATQLVKIR